ncbi:MAG: 2-oxo acid dehydrogenase subunit E2 [Legionella sp.]|nr:2-oxo acid dehydrogenase subunit E2 [Legionella sp.]
MDIFNLPDLGEGLPDAEIHEWFIHEGDEVIADQPLVSVETAKAVVEVPSPQSGRVVKLFGKIGDVIKTGAPLIAFESSASTANNAKREDAGTVVGHLETSEEVHHEPIITSQSDHLMRAKATPMVRMLARKLKVDLNSIQGTGEHGLITRADVEAAAMPQEVGLPEGYVPLRGVRRAMVHSMVRSHQEVVPVSIFDEADVHRWDSTTDITVRLIRAMVAACESERALNAWFDTNHHACKYFDEVNLGLAMDSQDGLFVPVIHHAGAKTDHELRQQIDRYKKEVTERSVKPENLQHATITLSNFGKFSGLFASPIIVPPMVAIVAVGRMYEKVVLNKGSCESHRFLPLSLSFDHRAATGGEASRFLGKMIGALEES